MFSILDGRGRRARRGFIPRERPDVRFLDVPDPTNCTNRLEPPPRDAVDREGRRLTKPMTDTAAPRPTTAAMPTGIRAGRHPGRDAEQSYIDYAMSGHRRPRAAGRPRRPQARAPAPVVRDERRRLPPGPPYVKSARRRLTSMGSTTRTVTRDLRRLVRLVPWSMRYPLIDGQGNFGSPATTARPPCATPSAGSRRWPWRWCATSTRRPSTSSPTTTARPKEPTVLPARFPTC